jgi:putative ABC transport system ATP-binding protein
VLAPQRSPCAFPTLGRVDNEILSLIDVSKTYGRGRRKAVALHPTTLGFAEGTFTAIMGPSGSGKSTLLHCAAGLDRPSSGSVMLEGRELGNMNEEKLTRLRRDTIGFIFQSYNLFPTLSVRENVELPLRLRGRHPRASQTEVHLEQVGLGGRASSRPGELSGGQQQRVAIARALAAQPRVLFGDEPTGALDSDTAAGVMRLIRILVDGGQTTVIVTHDPAVASWADRVVFLRDGQIHSTRDRSSAGTIAEEMSDLSEVSA